MNKIKKQGIRLLASLFSTKAALVYISLFAISIAIATFIENDFGTSSAQKIVYTSWWFEVLLSLFGISILVNIFKYRMIQQKKWTVLLFHSAVVVILIGAGITRYFGFEGMMHIRENNLKNSFLSTKTYLKCTVTDRDNTYYFDDHILFAALGKIRWNNSYLLGDDRMDVEVLEYIPNPKQELIEGEHGKPTLHLVVSGVNGRVNYLLSQGQTKNVGGDLFNFNERQVMDAINILYLNDSLFIKANRTLTQMIMSTQEVDTLIADIPYPITLNSLYSDGIDHFVFSEFNKKGVIKIESTSKKVKNESIAALKIRVSVNGISNEGYVYTSKGAIGNPLHLKYDDRDVNISFGVKEIILPFSIKLNDFILDKYPGTNSASSYASKVTLIDNEHDVIKDFRIYMNNILNYRGYRFFQSSFDKDEKGTYLSVNHDYWGTLISYIGYALLTIGMFFTFFSRKTRFYKITQRIKKLRTTKYSLILILLISNLSFAQPLENGFHPRHAVDIHHANAFSELVVQDFNGRMKPMHTLSREVMRKLSRTENIYGLSADQVFLSIFLNGPEWFDANLIKLGMSEEIKKQINVAGDFASYIDFFSVGGDYKLQNEIRRVNTLDPIDRGTYEKELLKTDEKLNILNMVFSGSFLKIIPNPKNENNVWDSYDSHILDEKTPNTISNNFFTAYHSALKDAVSTNDYSQADYLLEELKKYQQQNSREIIPSSSKIKAEILLNNSNIFNRLALLYGILGIAFLFFLFLSVFKPNVNLTIIYRALVILMIIGFIAHTLGLCTRWYISGRAPWSNGYESMIYIAWTTTLAGIIIARRSFGGLAATMVLAATILMVSMLSFLDPEITPLVPVLKSYWLTIHVSMEAGSYGFLMLSAFIGLINLILVVFLTNRNKASILRIVKEMSYISELVLYGGLFMICIGTFLGGVWANESWGRYWGWDAKETWALITILIYAIIIHLRLVPKFTGIIVFNVSTIIGLGSVLMTYYGVNYYLSGLHSYATGDPVPIPYWLYIVIGIVTAIITLAYFKKRKHSDVTK